MSSLPDVSRYTGVQLTATPASVQALIDRAAGLVGGVLGTARQLILDQLGSCSGAVESCLVQLRGLVAAQLEAAHQALQSVTSTTWAGVEGQLALAMALGQELGIELPPWLPQQLPETTSAEAGSGQAPALSASVPDGTTPLAGLAASCAPGLCAGLAVGGAGTQAQEPSVPCDRSVRALGRPFPPGVSPFPFLPPGVAWDSVAQQVRIVDSSALAAALQQAGQPVLPFGGLVLGGGGYQLPVGAVGYEVPPLDYWCPYTATTAGPAASPGAAPAEPASAPSAAPAEPSVTPPPGVTPPGGTSGTPGCYSGGSTAAVTVISDDQGYLDSPQSASYRSWLEGWAGSLRPLLDNPPTLADAITAFQSLVSPNTEG